MSSWVDLVHCPCNREQHKLLPMLWPDIQRRLCPCGTLCPIINPFFCCQLERFTFCFLSLFTLNLLFFICTFTWLCIHKNSVMNFLYLASVYSLSQWLMHFSLWSVTFDHIMIGCPRFSSFGLKSLSSWIIFIIMSSLIWFVQGTLPLAHGAFYNSPEFAGVLSPCHRRGRCCGLRLFYCLVLIPALDVYFSLCLGRCPEYILCFACF